MNENVTDITKASNVIKIVEAYYEGQTIDGKPFSKEKISELARGAEKFSRKCILCGNERYAFAFFEANKDASKRLGASNGKVRSVPYGVCKNHFNAENQAEHATAIEEILFEITQKFIKLN